MSNLIFRGVFLTFFLCLSGWLVVAPAQTPKPRHIVVFLSDDHGQLDSEPYGATDVRTPNMKARTTRKLRDPFKKAIENIFVDDIIGWFADCGYS
jgi:hypothetical protein